MSIEASATPFSRSSREQVQTYKSAVCGISHSGKPKELIEKFGISAAPIVTTVKFALR